jgi:hypothetical protein
MAKRGKRQSVRPKQRSSKVGTDCALPPKLDPAVATQFVMRDQPDHDEKSIREYVELEAEGSGGAVSRETVTVRFTISLDESQELGGPPITFSRWLPMGREHGIGFQHETCTGLLWFELKSASWISDEATIPKTINVLVDNFLADVVTTVDGELAAWMVARDCRHAPTADDEALAARYRQHGEAVTAALNHGLNRFLSFVKIEKGQYWVPLVTVKASGEARAKTHTSDWFRWCPTHVIELTATMPNENDPRFIRPEDWPRAQAFVVSQRRPTLTLELLASAELLAREGSDRAALTEAVTALEVALGSFARAPRAQALWPASMSERLGIETLPKVIERLGLTTSVAVVLPLLLPADVASPDVLSRCREAIRDRQNVVHQGQRQVKSIGKHLAGLRQLCELLLRYTDEPEDRTSVLKEC